MLFSAVASQRQATGDTGAFPKRLPSVPALLRGVQVCPGAQVAGCRDSTDDSILLSQVGLLDDATVPGPASAWDLQDQGGAGWLRRVQMAVVGGAALSSVASGFFSLNRHRASL